MSEGHCTRRDVLKTVGLGAAGAVLPGELSGMEPAAQEEPNILFILTDQHRRDAIGAYGKPGVKTPHIDSLGRDGIRFDRAYVAQPVCAPNRASIQSGLYPHAHGLLENTWPLSPRIQTMAEMLEDYDCGYFGKWHLGRQHTQGFDRFPSYPGDGRGDNHYFTIDGAKRYAVDVITDDVIGFMSEQRENPFYAFASYYPPHPPYSVPEKYEDMYRGLFPDDRRRRIYYAMATKVDEQVGRLLRTLDDLGHAENTLVVFTTEHGHFFNHRWNDHNKRLCYDTAARIPLLMRMPGVIPGGKATSELISSVDLVQTIMSLVGREVPDGLQGKDLSTLARGERDRGREAAFIENFPYIDKGETPGPYPNEPMWGYGEERCVRGRSWKLILSTVRPPEIYDMDEDPEETNNRWRGMRHLTEAAALTEALHEWAVRTGDNLAPKLIRKI